ncbi:MAG: sugar phosphate isomerase/epimerase family protein [Candidatus Latescibacterota bacterium]|nr:sugar phosphate isomerase/epimerase family protein [Candidatus Latescibacterota bacterium]
MKLYYSTYGMKQLDIFNALPRLRDMGFEGMEIAVSPGWPTEPAAMDTSARLRLAELLRELEFPTPAIMALLSPCVEGDDRARQLDQFRATFKLARDLRIDDSPLVISTTLGHPKPAWEQGKERIAELVIEVADMAATYDVIVAVEPHAGGDFETPEKAAWLMERTEHEHLGLNFDYSHFWVEGIDLQHSIDLNLPYAVHNHIKDGYRDDEGKVRYLLPGDGELDVGVYFRAVVDAGWDSYFCPEVTGQIWNRDDYDPWETAQACYDALARARLAVR